MIRITKILIIISFLTSCSRQTISDSNLSKIDSSKLKFNDSFNSLLNETINDYSHQLKLESLKNGFDSLQIRIWFDYSIVPERRLFIIKRKKSKWIAISYKMTLNLDSTYQVDSLKTIDKFKSIKMEELKPKNGWNNFMNKLLSLKITTLPNSEEIKGFESDMDDGILYMIEIATKDKYRFYYYENPEELKDKFWQAKNLVDIIQLIKSEFKIEK